MSEKKDQEKTKKIKIPPIALVIAAAAAALICVIVIIVIATSGGRDEMLSEPHEKTEASCINKSITSDDSGETYYIDVEFQAKTADGEFPFTVRMTETDSRLKDIDIGDKLDIYYRTEDPSFCHPAFLYPDYTAAYIILALIIAACAVVIFLNVDTIIRNRHGYVPKFTKPDEIGYMGELGAESGLDDKSIDYAASDVFSSNVMDSYVDPFASYTGYDEDGAQGDGSGQTSGTGDSFDPNASYTDISSGSDDSGDFADPFAPGT